MKVWATTNGAKAAGVDAEWLRELCLAAGADDVGFVEIGREELARQREGILAAFPQAQTLASIVVRLHRETSRSPVGPVAHAESRIAVAALNQAAHTIAMKLESKGVKAVWLGASSLPLESDQHPEKGWLVSHKAVAIAAGVGQMGLHRCIIHPSFGSLIVLGTVLVAAKLNQYGTPLQDNPCCGCKLCVEVCPVGAIAADGYFNFSACMTYNYWDLMGGCKGADTETVAQWQSLAAGASYKNACCCAVCPAGEEVIGQFVEDRQAFVRENVLPLKQRAEVVYVIPGSDAEQHVARCFPRKKMKRVAWSLRPRSIKGFLEGLPLLFQRQQSRGIERTFHFRFTGEEPAEATVTISNRTLTITKGCNGRADLRVAADSEAWVSFLAEEVNVIWMLLRGKIRIKGSFRALSDFKRCFPA